MCKNKKKNIFLSFIYLSSLFVWHWRMTGNEIRNFSGLIFIRAISSWWFYRIFRSTVSSVKITKKKKKREKETWKTSEKRFTHFRLRHLLIFPRRNRFDAFFFVLFCLSDTSYVSPKQKSKNQQNPNAISTKWLKSYSQQLRFFAQNMKNPFSLCMNEKWTFLHQLFIFSSTNKYFFFCHFSFYFGIKFSKTKLVKRIRNVTAKKLW